MLRFGRAIAIGSIFLRVAECALVEPHGAGTEHAPETVGREPVVAIPVWPGLGGAEDAPNVVARADPIHTLPAAAPRARVASMSHAAGVVAWVAIASTFSLSALAYLGKNTEYVSRVMGAEWADLAMCAFGGVSMAVSFECARGLMAGNGEALSYRHAGQVAVGFLSALSAMAMLVAASSQDLVAPPVGGALSALIMRTAPELHTVVAPAVRAGSKKILNALSAVFSREIGVSVLEYVRGIDAFHWQKAVACTLASVSVGTCLVCLSNAEIEFRAQRYKTTGGYLLAGIMAAILVVGVLQASPTSYHGPAHSTPISRVVNEVVVDVARIVQRLANDVIDTILER